MSSCRLRGWDPAGADACRPDTQYAVLYKIPAGGHACKKDFQEKCAGSGAGAGDIGSWTIRPKRIEALEHAVLLAAATATGNAFSVVSRPGTTVYFYLAATEVETEISCC